MLMLSILPSLTGLALNTAQAIQPMLLPIISKERKRHEKRKKLLAEISNHFAAGEKLLTKAEEMLGTDDPIVHKLQTALSVYKNAFGDIANFIERGKMLEKFRAE